MTFKVDINSMSQFTIYKKIKYRTVLTIEKYVGFVLEINTVTITYLQFQLNSMFMTSFYSFQLSWSPIVGPVLP